MRSGDARARNPDPSRIPERTPNNGSRFGDVASSILSIQEHKAPNPDGATTYASGWREALAERIGRYDNARRRSDELIGWLGQNPSPMGDRARVKLSGCAGWVEFERFLNHPDLPARLASAAFCQQPRLCQLCAIRRSVKLVRSYVPKLLADVGAGATPYLATFTLRNGPDLGERFELLQRSISRALHGARRSRSTGQACPWAVFTGGVFSVEFKRGAGSRGGMWHPHAHGVLLSAEPLSPAALSAVVADWCELTRESDPRGQDIRPLESVAAVLSDPSLESTLSDALSSDLLEVFKYPLKFSNLSPADRWRAYHDLRGRHLIRSFGSLWGKSVADSPDDIYSAADGPLLKYLFRWAGSLQLQRISLDDNPKKV